jgi:pimeloyl-ACP methyl ester carboxylesterase
VARFLLIHGSCHGAWCWRDLIPALATLGHEARAIDLPSHGADRTPAADATLDLYAERILVDIDAPVTLVGHSAAGYPITLAAERAPEKIARLVYLCAYVPLPGMSMIDMRRAGPRQLLKGAVRVDPGGVTYSVEPTQIRDRFYQDCSEKTVAYAAAHLCPEPIGPQSTVLPPLARWQGVERHYIRCAKDQAIPPEYQATMAAGFPEDNVTSLPTSHSPFFSAPERLAARLHQIAGGLPDPARAG